MLSATRTASRPVELGFVIAALAALCAAPGAASAAIPSAEDTASPQTKQRHLDEKRDLTTISRALHSLIQARVPVIMQPYMLFSFEKVAADKGGGIAFKTPVMQGRLTLDNNCTMTLTAAIQPDGVRTMLDDIENSLHPHAMMMNVQVPRALTKLRFVFSQYMASWRQQWQHIVNVKAPIVLTATARVPFTVGFSPLWTWKQDDHYGSPIVGNYRDVLLGIAGSQWQRLQDVQACRPLLPTPFDTLTAK